MAEVWPQEGLDYLLSIVPRSSQPPSYLWMGLFTSPGATVVIAPTEGMAQLSEVVGSFGYVRATISATFWGAPTFYASGRQITATLVAFPTADGVWGSVNGFFLSATSGPSRGAVLFAANFDDNTQLPIATFDRVSVQPAIKFGY